MTSFPEATATTSSTNAALSCSDFLLHKFALVDMAEGESVVKYGFCIGNATSAVKKGDGIHIHNLKTRLGDLLDYIYGPDFVEEKVCE